MNKITLTNGFTVVSYHSGPIQKDLMSYQAVAEVIAFKIIIICSQLAHF